MATGRIPQSCLDAACLRSQAARDSVLKPCSPEPRGEPRHPSSCQRGCATCHPRFRTRSHTPVCSAPVAPSAGDACSRRPTARARRARAGTLPPPSRARGGAGRGGARAVPLTLLAPEAARGRALCSRWDARKPVTDGPGRSPRSSFPAGRRFPEAQRVRSCPPPPLVSCERERCSGGPGAAPGRVSAAGRPSPSRRAPPPPPGPPREPGTCAPREGRPFSGARGPAVPARRPSWGPGVC